MREGIKYDGDKRKERKEKMKGRIEGEKEQRKGGRLKGRKNVGMKEEKKKKRNEE